MAYLKVLMDEIIGRHKNIGQIAVRMSHSAGLKRRAKSRRLIKNTEYMILINRRMQAGLNLQSDTNERKRANQTSFFRKTSKF